MTTLMIGCTIMVLALPVPIIVSNFVVANDLLTNDKTVTTYYFDEKKSNQVKNELETNGAVTLGDGGQEVGGQGERGQDASAPRPKVMTTEC